ncbi:hypothetical protein BV96_00522 [Sphingomonas paucimobilis]|nr:hypothetical protein BV96_00522 [Sphingomonas paucimobilis]
MSFRRAPLPLAMVAALFPTASMAQMDHGQPQCAAGAELPAPLASWRSPTPLRAAADTKAAARTTLTPGQAVTLTLRQTPKVSYAVRPAKPGGGVSYGGLASFTVAQSGTWRVALGSGAWVDVVIDGKAAESVAHGHGPNCSGIRKMVDYSLHPGRYTLQIAANGEERLTLLVTPSP